MGPLFSGRLRGKRGDSVDSLARLPALFAHMTISKYSDAFRRSRVSGVTIILKAMRRYDSFSFC